MSPELSLAHTRTADGSIAMLTGTCRPPRVNRQRQGALLGVMEYAASRFFEVTLAHTHRAGGIDGQRFRAGAVPRRPDIAVSAPVVY